MTAPQLLTKSDQKLHRVVVGIPASKQKIEVHLSEAKLEELCSLLLRDETSGRTTKPNWTATK